MKTLYWLILDSFGIGGAPDAAAFGDEGSDTLGHIAEWFVAHEERALALPTLAKLGLGEAYRLVHGRLPAGWQECVVSGAYAAAIEISTGKDTPSGHWEMAGVPARWDWAYYPQEENCFPSELIARLHREAVLPGSLGHCHASGTEVIARLGAESVATGQPIFYTSADSVFQIAAHEESFGLERLYELCQIAREATMEPLVGRVIARPFVGEAGAYERTGNRKDFAVAPPKPTVLERVKAAGFPVIGVGKVGDIFAHQGMTRELKASGHEALWRETRESGAAGGLVMTNFVDFDMVFGHRRDPRGYGLALEDWDAQLSAFIREVGPDDAVVVTADHGNDPTWRGTDHTRERVPVLMTGGTMPAVGSHGVRESFADIGATVARFFGVEMDEGQPIG